MAKYCYKQFKNGKWYTEADIRQLQNLSKRLKDGEDVAGEAKKVLDKGLDELPGEVVEETLREGRFTREELKKDFDKMNLVFSYSPGETISVGDAIQMAADQGYISKQEEGFSKEFDIASRALEGQGINFLEMVALQRAIAIVRDQVYDYQQKLDAHVASGESTAELESLLESKKSLYDLFAYAYSMNVTDRARGMAFILHMNAILFDPVKEMERLRTSFPNATEKQLKAFQEIVDAIDAKRRELTQVELDVEKAKQKAARTAASKGFAEVKKEAKSSQPTETQEVKSKTFLSEVLSKAKKDPVGTFKEMFAGAFRSKVKFQGDGTSDTSASAEEYERAKVEVIMNLSRHLVKEEGITELEPLIQRVMGLYNELDTTQESLKESDIINAFALKSVNSTKQPEYVKALSEIRATAKKIDELSKLLNGVVKQKGPKRADTRSKTQKKIKGLIADLQRVQYIGVDGAMTPAEQEAMFTNLEKVSEAYRIFNNTASEEVIKQKTVEIAETLAKLNSKKVEDRLKQRLSDLENGTIVDTRKTYIKPFLTKDAFGVKEEIEELRRKLKHKEIEAEIDKYFEKYSDKKVAGMSIRSLMKKKKALSDLRTFWNLTSRYKLGGDLGTMLLHGGYDTMAIIGKALTYQWATKSGRQQMATNLKGIGNFWVTNVEMFTAGLMETDARDTILDQYKQMAHNPSAVLARQLGLAIVRPFSTELITNQDDFFMGKGISDLLEGNTLVTKGLKIAFTKFDTASEGSYVMGLNVLRLNLFNAYKDSHPNASVKELEAIAREINTSTGKGALKDARALSMIFTAPKLYWSRLQLLLGTPKYMLQLASSDAVKRATARYRIGNNMAFLAGHVALMYLAGMTGWEWEKDPRSSNFLKLVKGDKTMDLTAGFSKWISMLFATPAVYLDNKVTGGTVMEGIWGPPDVGEEFMQITDHPTVVALKRLSYLLHGSVHALWGVVLGGENAIGQPYGTDLKSSVYGWLVNNYAPMSLADLIEPGKFVDDNNKENRGFFEAAGDHFSQVIGTGLMSFDNNMKHNLVVDYLSNLQYIDKGVLKRGVEPKDLFASDDIEKVLPEVAAPGIGNYGIKKRFKSEIEHIVGTKILDNINETGEGKYTKAQLKALYKAEAKKLAKLYKDEYY